MSNEEILKIQASIFRAAGILALISALLLVIITALVLFFEYPAFESSLTERLSFIAAHQLNWQLPLGLSFLFIAIQIPLLLGLYYLTRRHHFVLALTGVIFGIIGVSTLFQNLFASFTAVPMMAKLFAETGDEMLKYVLVANFNQFGLLQMHATSFSAVILAATLLGICQLLFGISVVNKVKLPRISGWLLTSAGFFGILGAIGYIFQLDILVYSWLLQLFSYFCALLVMSSMFSTEAILNLEISKKGEMLLKES